MSFFDGMGRMPMGQHQQLPQQQQQPTGQFPPQQQMGQQFDMQQHQMHPSYFSGFQMPQQWQQRFPQAGGFFSHFGGQQ